MAAREKKETTVPVWAERILERHDRMIARMDRQIKRQDELLREVWKDVRYTKDLVEDHERWVREQNRQRLSRKVLR